MWGIMPGVVAISSKFDLFFVNSLHLPPNSGMIFHILIMAFLLVAAIKFSRNSENNAKNGLLAIAALFFTGIWVVSGSAIVNILVLAAVAGAIWFYIAKDRVVLSTMLTSILVIMIGYSSMAIIVIRSSASTPLNEDNPSNPLRFSISLTGNSMAKDRFSGDNIIMLRCLIIRTARQYMHLKRVNM